MDFKYIIIRASSALLLLSGPLFTACDDDDPDAFITVSKQEIEVEYYDSSWKKQRQKLSGWTAQIAQHEINHLSGKII